MSGVLLSWSRGLVVAVVRLWLAVSQLDTNIMIPNNQYPLQPNIIIKTVWSPSSHISPSLVQGRQALNPIAA